MKSDCSFAGGRNQPTRRKVRHMVDDPPLDALRDALDKDQERDKEHNAADKEPATHTTNRTKKEYLS